MLTENIDKTFAHIAINAALDRIFNGWDSPFHFKKNIEKPFGVGVEMLPMGNEHMIADGFVAVIHSLFKGWDILRRALLDNLTEHFPVFVNMVVAILLGVADTPVTGNGKNDVVFLQ